MIKLCSNCKIQIKVAPCREKEDNFCSAKCSINFRLSRGWKPNTKAAHEALRKKGRPDRLGKPAPWITQANADIIKQKISKAKTNKRIPKLQGNKHWNWKGGVDKGIWFTWEYKQWRKAVFERDNYTCVWCGDNKGGNLEADHIKPKSLFPELVFDINNGRTLCKGCHRKTNTWGRKALTSY